MTEESIMSLALRNGMFALTWHYRVDYARQICYRLVKKGWLTRTRHNRGVDEWRPTKKAYLEYPKQ